jgi:hypothetical protein
LSLSLALPAALLSLLALGVPAAASAQENPAIQVHLADGTSLLLRSWTFSYEYQTWRRGEAPALGGIGRRDAKDLWTGKKILPLGNQAIELQYADQMRAVDGLPAKVPIARGFVLVSADGKRKAVKAEPPDQDLLLPDAGGRLVQARAMDLRGETIGSTRREFCLLSYSSLVECPAAADQRVVRMKLQP